MTKGEICRIQTSYCRKQIFLFYSLQTGAPSSSSPFCVSFLSFWFCFISFGFFSFYFVRFWFGFISFVLVSFHGRRHRTTKSSAALYTYTASYEEEDLLTALAWEEALSLSFRPFLQEDDEWMFSPLLRLLYLYYYLWRRKCPVWRWAGPSIAQWFHNYIITLILLNHCETKHFGSLYWK